jgi:hypothetical protein
MVDEPADRQRGLGLLVQLIPALTFANLAVPLLMWAMDRRDASELAASAPLASLAMQFATGWVLVRKRPRAVPFAVASVVVALAATGVMLSQADDTDALSIATMVLELAGWPIATLVAVIRGPRTPYTARRADLGGALLAYGAILFLVGAFTVISFAVEMSRFGGAEPWQLVVYSSPLLGVLVSAVFGILSGIELAGALRPGRSRLTMYLVVTLIITLLVFAVATIGIFGEERLSRFNSTALQVAALVLGLANLYALPFVVWRYARKAKPLDVADSAGAASVLRWASLYFAIVATARLVSVFAGESRHGLARRFSRMLTDLDTPGALILGLSIAQIALAVAVFVARKRRAVMWGSLAIASMATAIIAIVLIGSGGLRLNVEGSSQNLMAFGLFAALAWLHRPRVRDERSLAAIFE